MSYDQKIQYARQIIDAHNENVEEKIFFDDFMAKLTAKDMGGTSEEALKACSWEDLQSCGLPKLMARSLAKYFRQGESSGSTKSAYVSERKAASLSFKELLERYSPRDSKSKVAKRLKELSEGKPCIVFDDNNKIIIDVSFRLLEDIVEGLPLVTTAFVGEGDKQKPRDVFKIGERPDFYAVENPLYPSEILRSGESCSHTGRSWAGISNDVRQLLWIAIEKTSELLIDSPSDAIDVLDRVVKKECTLDSLRSRYPSASKVYDEASKMGVLPRLSLRVGYTKISADNRRGNNPFGENETY